MRTPGRRLAALLTLLAPALLSGCDTPRVFHSEPPDPLAELPATRAVLVRPVVAAADPASVAARLVEALAREAIPATTRAGAIDGALVLEARPVQEGDAIGLDWVLASANGSEIGRFRHRLSDSDDAVREVARKVAALLAPPEAAGLSATTIAIGAVTAPGDGAAALRAALVGQLEARGLVVVPDRREAGFVLEGTIRVSPAGAGRELAVVVWQVRSPNGVIGTVRQSETLPAGRLARTWGPLARDVALGAAEGVVDLLRQAGANPPPAMPFTGYDPPATVRRSLGVLSR